MAAASSNEGSTTASTRQQATQVPALQMLSALHHSNKKPLTCVILVRFIAFGSNKTNCPQVESRWGLEGETVIYSTGNTVGIEILDESREYITNVLRSSIIPIKQDTKVWNDDNNSTEMMVCTIDDLNASYSKLKGQKGGC